MTENKFEIGDEVLLRAKVTRYAYGRFVEVELTGYDGLYRFMDEEVFPAQPEPIRWRDGAKERPENGMEVYWIFKDIVGTKAMAYTKVFDKTNSGWNNCYWLPASDFLMPALPEEKVVIEKCFMENCAGECELTNEVTIGSRPYNYRVSCQQCGYQTAGYDTGDEAINAHNRISKKVW